MVFQTRSGFSLASSADESRSPSQPARLTLQGPLDAGAFRLQRSARSNLPFASITSGLQVGTPGSTSLLRREPATGIEFPTQYCHLTKDKCPELTGLGARVKRILGLKNLNVYALGIYVDPLGANKALSKYRGGAPEALADNQQMYDDVIASDGYEKSLRLVISYGHLQRQQFVNALEERLKPLLHKAGEPAAMRPFSALFDGVDFQKGLDITFVDAGKGQLVTNIAGQQRGVIESPALVRSLFEVYLGADPASLDAKKSFGIGLASALNEPQ